MKRLLNTALLTGCLCASLMGYAQISETLLDENFDDNKIDHNILSLKPIGELHIDPDYGGQSNHLEIFHWPINLPPILYDLVYKNDDALLYDSLEASFVFDPRLTSLSQDPFFGYYYNDGQFRLHTTNYHGFYYKDEINDTVFTSNAFISYSLNVWPGDAKWAHYNPDTKSLRIKWGKQSELRLLSHHIMSEFHVPTCGIVTDNFATAWDCFCNTTTNPSDCKQKGWQPPFFPLKYAIDNLVIKGIQNIPTGIEDASEMPFKEKEIVKSVDLMGRDILDLANYTGPAIVMFSDGSREKRVF